MRLPTLLTLLFAGVATACDGQAPATAQKLTKPTPPKPARAMNPAAPAPGATPYVVRGVIDPGLNNMVAFALKIPRGWQFTQQFTRKWNGSTPISQVSLRMLAPDGGQQIDFLPERPYYFQDGPTSRSLRQQAASMGLAMPRHDEYELAPMPALAYIKQVLLPDLARQGVRLQPTGEHTTPPHATGPNATQASAYVDGRLPNGRLARVECQVNLQATNTGGEVYYSWSALPSLTQASANLSSTFAYTQAARKSFSINPAWQRQTQQLARRGQVDDFAITQRDAAAYKDYQNHQQKLNEEMAADRDRSQRQIAEGRGDVLSGQARYDNVATGDRYRVDDRYTHVYQDRNGALHGSNVPLDAGALNWQELQRVEMSGY